MGHAIQNKRISSDEDFTLAVDWTRDGEPVEIVAAHLVLTPFGAADVELATLEDGRVTQVDEAILVTVPQVSMPDLTAGPGYYVFAVETVTGERIRLVEGGLSIQKKVVQWPTV